ncbi:hypothetical protein [Acetobacter pasteurianus]|uniref:Uncharacterized protein n=1 Tax=Acetobacter pasteurianus subsp. pasteurianus TaxID=481145 RepID=A0A1Y0Y6P0_ACEPA|nr:hypothetical protein [Acetobacter pasteurianus]ARW47846.1 hypothetical protein S1001342_01520 [Acetobacter pasteurianus subsp. pasteurianus]
MELTQRLLKLTDCYCAARSISDATVSGIIFKNSRTIPRIRSGGDITTRNYSRAVEWFASNWPDDCAWPRAVERTPAQEATR